MQYELGGGRFNEAIQVLNRYVAQYPSSPRVRTAKELLAAAYYNSHNYDEAYEIIASYPDPDGDLLAAIRAAGKIGGQEALNALVAQLGGAHAKEASAALAAFNGKPNAAFVAALDGTPAAQANAQKLVAKRRITSAADKVFALLNSPDRAVRAAAYGALALRPPRTSTVCAAC